MGCRTNRGEEIIDQGQVEHLFQGDAAQQVAPPANRFFFCAGNAFAFFAFEAPLSVEISTHDRVFKLRCFSEQVNQFFTVIHGQACLFIH